MRAPKLELVTAAGVEPVVAADLAAWLGAPAADPLLTTMAIAARDICERTLGIALINQQWKQYFDLVTREEPWWDGVKEMPMTEFCQLPRQFGIARWPLNTVDHIKFYDELDAPTVADVASYYISKTARPPAIHLRPQYSWPSLVHRVSDAVEVQFSCGFGAAAGAVPDALKNGIKALAAYMYEHRGACDEEEALSKSGALGFWSPYTVKKL